MWRDLIATSVHEELARAEGVKVERVELGFILLIAVMTAIAMKIVGLLLITALMVIPAAAARRMATTPERMALIAATIAGLSVISGLLASAFIGGASGPCVCFGGELFLRLDLAGSAGQLGGREQRCPIRQEKRGENPMQSWWAKSRWAAARPLSCSP